MIGLKRASASRAATQSDDLPDRLLCGVLAAEHIAFALCDGDGVVVRAGGDFARVLGSDPGLAPTDAIAEELVGRRIVDILDDLALCEPDGSKPLDIEDMDRVLKAVCATRQEHHVETLGLARNGRTLSIACAFSGDGTVMATLRDISRIAADRAMLNTAMRGAGAGYWSMDLRSGEFTFGETVTARLTEAERIRVARDGLFTLVHRDDMARVASQWQGVLAGVEAFDFTYRVQTELDGLMWQRMLGQLMRGHDGKLTRAVAFVMDITEDMKNRADLAEAQDLAKSKEDFLARMSHEIRTPLNAIIGMADSLSDEAMSDPAREVVREMEEAAESLHDLLSRTLDHAKLQSGAVEAQFEPTDPRTVLSACAQMWRPKADAKGLEFRLVLDPGLPQSLPLDTFRVRQCLNNLLSNALKFTHAGSITMAAKPVTRGGRAQIAIVVRDTGIGMSAEEQRGVFDAYAQADGSITRRFGGTGLGLSICRQLAEVMDAEIVLRSEPDAGSSFVLFLPVEPKTRAGGGHGEPDALVPGVPVPAPGNPEGRLPFEGLSVLCVEDNPVNQKVVQRLIGGRVEQLHFANHGREALAVLNTVHVDVVLMDIHMPVMDGIETTMKIRQSDAPYANVIIIALTADPDYQQARICKNIGMNDTIAKPVRREAILEAFDRTLGAINEEYGVRVALR